MTASIEGLNNAGNKPGSLQRGPSGREAVTVITELTTKGLDA